MKVTPPKYTTEQPPATPANKAANRRGATQSNSLPNDDENAPNAAQSRDFASVLEDVTRGSRSRDEHEGDEGGERQETKSSAYAEREREAKRREDRHEGGAGGGGGFDQRGQVREAALVGDGMNARAILHIADLERIVAAVRTQLLANGRQEVTLELNRSVLEGLRVRLTTDAQGRVNAEFIAATEKVRAQLDARSGDLSELLRSRGIELASLRTTVTANDNQTASGDSSGRQAHNRAPYAVSGADAAPAEVSTAEDSTPDAHGAVESSSIYRA